MFFYYKSVKQFTSPTQQTGLLGEKIATSFLVNKGFRVIERNYTKKVGEIDIIATKEGVIHFIEVKAIVSRITLESLKNKEKSYNPFENVTGYKLKKLWRTIQWYIIERKVSRETLWQIDIIAVLVSVIFDPLKGCETKNAKVEVMWNVIQ